MGDELLERKARFVPGDPSCLVCLFGSKLGKGYRLWLASFFVGGFGSSPKHDAHAHSTLSAIQILAIQGALDRLDVERITSCRFLFPPSG